MSVLLHVVRKDHENSGYVWDEFYCPECLEKWIATTTSLEILRQVITTPQYLFGLYPQLVNEPVCDKCGLIFPR